MACFRAWFNGLVKMKVREIIMKKSISILLLVVMILMSSVLSVSADSTKSNTQQNYIKVMTGADYSKYSLYLNGEVQQLDLNGFCKNDRNYIVGKKEQVENFVTALELLIPGKNTDNLTGYFVDPDKPAYNNQYFMISVNDKFILYHDNVFYDNQGIFWLGSDTQAIGYAESNEDTYYIPLRNTLESLGYKVTWNGKESSVTITWDGAASSSTK